MKNGATRKLAVTALFAAVLAVCSQLSIPMPTGMPVTLQTFAVALCGFVCTWKRAPVSVLVWMALGAAGIPVFSNFTGGLAILAGPTGGFIVGFLPFATLCGAGRGKTAFQIVLGMSGLVICHLFGALQFAFVMKCTVSHAFLIASLPYIVKDVVSVTAACFTAKAIVRRTKIAI